MVRGWEGVKKKKRKEGWTDRGTGAEHGALQQMQWGVKGFFTAGVSRPGGKRATEILLCMIKNKNAFLHSVDLCMIWKAGVDLQRPRGVLTCKVPKVQRRCDREMKSGGGGAGFP